jgi:hypothetical protein
LQRSKATLSLKVIAQRLSNFATTNFQRTKA